MKRLLIGWVLAAFAAAIAVRYVIVPRRRNAQLADLTKEELYRRAQVADVPGRSEMTKEELIRALERS